MYLYILLYLLAASLLAFFAYGIDKAKARRGRRRIPERTLLLLALIGGSVGALIGMKVFRHKTKHLKFTVGVPLILILQILLSGALLYLIYMK